MNGGQHPLEDQKQGRDAARPSRVLIVTGLSGSGKTVALRAVEDADFFCVDNLPVSLIATLVNTITTETGTRDIAVGIDVRARESAGDIARVLDGLRRHYRIEILYLEAEPEVLVRRFKETRRPHPLGGEMEAAVRTEMERVSAIKHIADRIIDTSSLSPHQLRKLVTTLYSGIAGKELSVSLISFGFKYGVSQNIDLLFDVRFLPNPYFIPLLRDLNGTDRQVSDYVLSQPETVEFLAKVKDLLDFLIPFYVREGKSYLSIAFGCTGGRHRSPAIAEEMARRIVHENIELNVVHRDLS